MNVLRASSIILALLLLAPVVRAAESPDSRDKVLPCRPTIACTADITAAGTSEVEAGALFRRVDDTGRQWTFPLLTKLSLSRFAQLQVGTNGYSIARGRVPAQYLDDVTVGPKLHLVDQGALVPSLAFSAAASIPTFRRAGYERTYDALLTAYVTKDFGWLHADLNFGLNVWRVEDAPKKQPFVALALSVPRVEELFHARSAACGPSRRPPRYPQHPTRARVPARTKPRHHRSARPAWRSSKGSFRETGSSPGARRNNFTRPSKIPPRARFHMASRRRRRAAPISVPMLGAPRGALVGERNSPRCLRGYFFAPLTLAFLSPEWP